MKKSILSFIAISLLGGQLFAGDGQSTLTITIQNLKNQDGKVSVSLFDNDEDFLNKGIRKSVQIENDGSVVVVFENLENGEYAASVIHDENDNGELDTAVFGIPTEPYGFSNDARGAFGPASYEDSKFSITGNTNISITLN